MRLLLVVNPAASAVTDDDRRTVAATLDEEHDLTVVETVERRHASGIAREAAANGYDAVVVLAGDGTVNEAANSLVGTSTALGVLPGGSTNVFARTIGMGRRPAEATTRLREVLATDSRRRIGVGVANGRAFLCNAGMGFDAAVVQHVEQVEQRLPLKRVLGQAVFAYCATATWLCRFDRSRPLFTVRFGPDSPEAGSPAAVEASFAICLNTDPYTYLGSRALNVGPKATLDSALSLAAVRTVGLATITGVLASAFGRDVGLAGRDDVVLRDDLRAATIVGHRPFLWQVDGDLAGTTETLELAYRPDCLDVLLPRTGPTHR